MNEPMVDEENYYSDDVTSDIEAELYAQIYHETVTILAPLEGGGCGDKKGQRDKKTRRSDKVATVTTPKKARSCDKKPRRSDRERSITVATPTKKSLFKTPPDWIELSSPTKSIKSKMSDSDVEVLVIKRKDKQPNVPVIDLASTAGSCSSDDDAEVKGSKVRLTEELQLNLTQSDLKTVELVTPERKRKVERRMKKREENKKTKIALNIGHSKDLYPSLGDDDSDDSTHNALPSASSHWRINDRDRFKREFQQTSVYKKRAMLNRMVCSNCKESGHLWRQCDRPKSQIKCFLCGTEGHNGKACTHPVCPTCLVTGHTQEYCLWSREFIQLKCTICHNEGHLREECPDLWRRFHLTTRPNSPIVQPEVTSLRRNARYCYNCGRRGHFGFKCQLNQSSRHVIPADPTIVSYNEPEYDLPTPGDPYSDTRDPKQEIMCKSLYIHKHRLAREANHLFCRDWGIAPPFPNLQERASPLGGIVLGDSELTVTQFMKGVAKRTEGELGIDEEIDTRMNNRRTMKRHVFVAESDGIPRSKNAKRKKKRRLAKIADTDKPKQVKSIVKTPKKKLCLNKLKGVSTNSPKNV